MMTLKDILRAGALGAVLLAGSCAAPTNDGRLVTGDPEFNHPITVQPSYQSIKLTFSPQYEGLMPEDAARLSAFVQGYRDHGNGAISISVPAGPSAQATIHYFGERLASMGIARAHILVGTHDVANADTRVEVGYVGYVAQTAPCGDWSQDLDDTFSNAPAPNFGCAVQHNLAAMVADPRDLIEPRPMGPSDATRRATIMQKYEKGDTTSASKTADQSGAVADVDK